MAQITQETVSEDTPQNSRPLVEMQGIVKRFPGVLANANVDFELQKGELHALLGENGAGKTTLMNILYGFYEPDDGQIFLEGRPVKFASSRDAIANGLGMVHQHFMLIPPFTVAENIILGQRSSREPLIEDETAVYAKLRALSEQYHLAIQPEAEVWTLSVGEQQRVEILKALYRGAEVLILDEPTAVLTPQEVDELLIVLERLREDGKSIVFITHKLDEAIQASERITVLRDGHVIDTVSSSDTDKKTLARMMVGRDVILRVPKAPPKVGEVGLKIDRLSADDNRDLPALIDVSLEVRYGEIVGIAGVAGNGQSELEEVISGLRKAAGGSVTLNGQEIANCTSREIGEQGLAHIPSDRYGMGLLSDFTVAENMVLQRVGEKPFTKRGLLDRRALAQEAERLVNDFDVRTPSVDTKAGTLSGGNAQKMILARELARNPQVLLAAQPTRGLDVSAIEYVHRRLIEQRDAGVAILLISTELDEVLTLSDRIAVIFEGRIVDVVDAEGADVHDIGLMMAGEKRHNNVREEAT